MELEANSEQDPTQEVNPYDAIVSEQQAKSQARAPLMRSAYVADKIEPEQAQEALRISRQSKLPASLILRNLQRGVKQEPPTQVNEYDAILEEAPRYSKWIENPINKAATKNDYENLKNLERILADQRKPWEMPRGDEEIQKSATAKVDSTLDRDWADYEANLAIDNPESPTIMKVYASKDQMRQEKLQAELERQRGIEKFIGGKDEVGIVEGFKQRLDENPAFLVPFAADAVDLANTYSLVQAAMAQENGTMTPDQHERLIEYARLEAAANRRGKSTLGTVAHIAQEIPQFAGSMMLTGGAFKLGEEAILGGSKAATVSFMKNALAKAVGTLAQSHLFALKTANTALQRMAPHGALGEDQQGNTVYRVAPGTGEPFYYAIPRAQLDTFADLFSAHVFGLWSPKNPGLGVDVLKKSILKEGIGEAAKFISMGEVAQLIKEVGGVAPWTVPTPIRALYDKKARKELLGQTVVGFAMGAGGTAIRNRFLPEKAEQTGKIIEDVFAHVDEMEHTKKDPETTREVIGEMTKDTPREFVYLDPKAAATFYQSQNLDPKAEIARITGKSDAFNVTHDIQIRTADVAARAKPEERAFLQDNLRFDPQDASRAELKQASEKAKEGQRKQADEIQQEEQTAKDDLDARAVEEHGQAIHADIKERLVRSGMPESQATVNADLASELFKTMSANTKISLPDLYQKYGPKISRPELAEVPKSTQYVRVLEQSGKDHIEPVEAASKSELLSEAEQRWPDATIEPLTEDQVKVLLPHAMGSEGDARVYAQGDEKASRGALSLGGDEGPIIHLLKNADPSTVPHELWHLGVNMLGDLAEVEGSDPQLKLDKEALAKAVGAESFDKLSDKQHEDLARLGEIYLREGVAPSKALRNAFARISAWIASIYEKFKSYFDGLDLSPEVRGIFDRMLATKQQIEAARAEIEPVKFFGENYRAMLSEKDAAEWEKVDAEARAADHQQLQAKLMRDLEKRQTKEYKARREQIGAEVQIDVDNRREQMAIANLERGTKPDGSALDEGQQALKLDRKSVEALYGADAIRDLPKRIFSKDGVPADDAAQYFGFTSGDEMLKAFRELQKPNSAKEVELRTRLASLEEQRKGLDLVSEPLKSEAAEATKEIKAGKDAIASRLEAALRAEERLKLKDISDLLADIRDRGGVRPVEKTENLPKSLRAKEGAGVSSDELAQELADRGILKDAYSDTLYDYLSNVVEAQKASRARGKEIPAEARKLAGEKLNQSIEALIENTRAQEELRGLIDNLSREQKVTRNEMGRQRDSLIEAATEQRMKAEYPELLESPTLPAEAMAAIHNDKSAERLRWQMQWIAKNHLSTLKKGIRAATGKPSIPEIATLRAHARDEVSLLPQREINLGVYQRAERSAGIAAREAFLKGNFEDAFGHKMIELLNHELYRAAGEVRERVEKMTDYMGSLSKPKVQERIGKAGGDYLERINDLLERSDFKQVTNRALDKRQSFRQWYENQKALADQGLAVLPDVPEHLLEDSYRKNWREMSFKELQGLHDTVHQLETLATLKESLIYGAKKRAFDEAVEGGVVQVEASGEPIKQSTLGDRGLGAERKHNLAEGIAAVSKMATIIREMDGFKDGGPMSELFLRPSNEAATERAVLKEKATKFLHSLFDDTYSAEENLRMNKQEFVPEIGKSVTRENRIMVAMNMGNADNLEKMRRSGDGSKDADGKPIGWSDEQLRAIVEPLEKKDWDLVQKWWDHLEKEYWPEIRDLQKRVTGLEPEKVEAQPVVTKYGTYRGGYHPLAYDDRKSETASKHSAEEMIETALRGESLRASTAHGHREARVSWVNLPIRYDFGVMFQHVNKVIHDLTHYEMLLDASRLLADKRMEGAVRSRYGPEVYREMKLWLRDIATGEKGAANAVEAGLNYLRKGTATANLALSTMQFVTDPTGIFQGARRIGIGAMAKGLMKFIGDGLHGENSARWIYEGDDGMRLRAKTSMREVNEIRNQIQTKGQLEKYLDLGLEKLTGGRLEWQDVRDTYFWLMAKAQQFQDIPTYLGAFDKAMTKMQVEKSPLKADEMEKRARGIAYQSVLDAYGGGEVKDLARVMRGGAYAKALTTFYGYMSSTLQGNIEAVKKFRKSTGQPIDYGRLAVDLTLLNVMPVVATYAIKRLVTGDDEDRNIATDLAKEELSHVAGLFPLTREISGPLRGQEYQGPAGYRFFAATGKVAYEAIKHERMDWNSANQAGGILFHYPALQVQRLWDGTQALIDGKTSNPVAPLFGVHRRHR